MIRAVARHTLPGCSRVAVCMFFDLKKAPFQNHIGQKSRGASLEPGGKV